jgi:hypothetical protein
MKTHILLTGINEYDRRKFGAGSSLRECVHDVDRVFRHFAYTSAETTLLTDELATKENVLTHLRRMAAVAAKGDRVIWHTSSHGSYYDTPQGRITMRLCHDDYLYDWEVAEAVRAFVRGVTVVISSDCCYAHSNSRDTGIPSEATPSEAVPRYLRALDPSVGLAIRPVVHAMPPRATVYYLSACEVDQVAYESPGEGGWYTTALLAQLRPGAPRLLTTIMRAVRRGLQGQSPTIEAINARLSRTPRF